MRRLLLTTALLLALPASALSALITVTVTDDGTNVGTFTSGTGAISWTTSDGNFADISGDASGTPLLPNADLSSTALNVRDTSVGTHTLVITVDQTGVSGVGPTMSTFTTNNLVGAPNIDTTEETLANGIGLVTHNFPAGTVSGHAGPFDVAFGAISSDEHVYTIVFTGAGSSNDTVQLTTGLVIPEASTWVMMALGFGLLGLVGYGKSRHPREMAA